MSENKKKERRRKAAAAPQGHKVETVGKRVSAIAHDLNNLLMGIQGNISLLLMDKPHDHRDVSYLKNIEKIVENASELTRQVRDTVRSGKEPAAASGDFPPETTQQPAAAETDPPSLKGILLVEDEEIVASIGEKMLTRLGYRVWIACNGNKAIELYEQRRSDIELVILDMVMPGMGGGEIFDRLRSINPQVAVLLSSGYSLNSQAMEIMKRGCRGFIQKPFNIEKLNQKINEVLSQG